MKPASFLRSPDEPQPPAVLASFRRSPLAGRAVTLKIGEGASLAELVEKAAPEPWLRAHVVASIDGVEIARAAWGEVVPRAGQAVVLSVRPANGGDEEGGGSNWLRTILAIIVIVVATVISDGAWTPATMEWAAPYLAAGFAIVGNLAINALIPLKSPTLGADRPAPFYSITGARNTIRPFGPVPTIFGRHRYTPPPWGQAIQETIGDDVYLRLPFCLGPAPVEISELRIGETLLSEFEGVEVETRLNADDPPHTLYTGDPQQELVGASITTEFALRTTPANVDEIEVVFGFRGGLGEVDKKNRKVTASVGLQVEYRLHGGEDDWSPLFPDTTQANGASAALGVPARTRFGEFYPNLSDYNAVLDGFDGVAASPLFVSRADPGRGFQTVQRWAVPRGQYDVRIRRTTAESTESTKIDAVWWELLSSRKTFVDPFPERKLASIVLRIKATGQLNSVVDTFNLIVEPKIPTFSDEAADDPASATAESHSGAVKSRNPADQTLWIYRGPQNANPKPDHEIDWPAWAEFYAWCRDQGLHYDEPIDSPITRGEMANRICAAAHARPCKINGRLSVIIDKPRTGEAPSQVFTPRNVRNFRWTKTFPAEVHAARIGFANAENGWQTDEVTLYLDGFNAENATKFETLELPGKTDPDEIRKVGRQYINNALSQVETFSFEMDAESLTATLGAYVVVQHDVMATGRGAARVLSLVMESEDPEADVAGVILDAPIATDAGPTLGAQWRKIVTEGGWARFEVANETAVSRDPEDPRAFTFAEPRPVATSPAIGDVFLVGETAQVSLEALVKSIAPEINDQASLTLAPYAGERFVVDGTPLPPHNPKTTIPLGARPAAPVLLSAVARSLEIAVSFQQPASPRGVVVTGFEAAVREHGDAADSWSPLGPLGAAERIVIVPAGDPGASYDVQIVAVGRESGGLVVKSDPLIVSEIAADEEPLPPEDIDGEFVMRESPSGARQLVFVASWEPNEDPDVLDTRIDIQTGEDEWSPIGGARASASGCEIHGLQVGRSYVFGFLNLTRRGAESDRVVLDPITAPDELKATSAVEADSAAPGSALDVDFSAALAAAVAAAASATAAAASAGTASTAAGVASTAATNAAAAQLAAEDALDAASDEADAAAASALSAAGSASAASGSASAAAGSATSASNSANAADGSSTAAASSASAAAASASSASGSASAASTSAGSAATSAGAAGTSASAASASAVSAAASLQQVGRVNLITRTASTGGLVVDIGWGKSGWGLRMVSTGGTSIDSWYADILGLSSADTAVSISFRAKLTAGSSATLHVDFFPDTLPEQTFTVTATDTLFKFENLSLAADTPAQLRFFYAAAATTMEITDIKVERGATATDWSPCPKDARNYASASATSAASAAASDAAAGSSASTATTQAGIATTKAGEASTSAGQAATSETNAAGSASTASTQAGNAATSASAAAGSASAASSSASTASTQATNAGNSASAASASQVAASSSAAATIPATFDDVTQWRAGGGTPTYTGGIFRASGGSIAWVYAKGYLPILSGHTYRATARHRVATTNGTNNGHFVGLVVLRNGAFSTLAWQGFTTIVGDGWRIDSYTLDAAALLALDGSADGVAPVFMLAYNQSTGTFSGADSECSSVRLEDITESTSAAGSASAAATSASSASTSASGAAASASAASGSATAAATSESNASTYAGQASTSAGDAASSATTAGTHASNAAGSASSASSSASSATASASAASASAALAASFMTPNANMVPDGGFQRQGAGWEIPAQWGWNYGTVGDGPYFVMQTDGTHVLTSPLFPVGLNMTYTLQMEALRFGTGSGNFTADIIWCDSGAAGISASARVFNETSPGGSWTRRTLTVTSPASGITQAVIRVFTEGITMGGGGVAVRRVKMEQGAVATAFSDDATVGAINAAVVTNAAATASAASAISSLSTSVTADFASTNASVSTLDSAVAAINAAAAFRRTVVAASGSEPAIEEMLAGPGGSGINLAARKLQLLNIDGDGVVGGLSLQGGNALLTGNLGVGGKVTVGAASVPVALEAKQLLIADGESFNYGYSGSLSTIPKCAIQLPGGVPLSAGEAWGAPSLVSMTTSGATLRMRINTPGTTTSVTSTTAMAGGGGAPDRLVDKTDSADAFDGNYFFRIQGTVTVTRVFDPIETLYYMSGSSTFTTWFYHGGSWHQGPDIVAGLAEVGVPEVDTSSHSGSMSFDLSFLVPYGTAIGGGAGGTYEFGVSGAALTGFSQVQWVKQSASGDRTGSPNGEKAIVTIQPVNA